MQQIADGIPTDLPVAGRAPITRGAYRSEAAFGDALAEHHKIHKLPSWKMASAAEEIIGLYGLESVVWGAATIRTADGREVTNPDAGFTNI